MISGQWPTNKICLTEKNVVKVLKGDSCSLAATQSSIYHEIRAAQNFKEKSQKLPLNIFKCKNVINIERKFE